MGNNGHTPYKRIGIVRFSALGDIVHTLPAFAALRHQFPQSHITWFAHPAGAHLLSCVTGLDAVEIVTLKKIPLQQKVTGLWETMRRHRHQLDLVLDFQGLLKSAIFSKLLGGLRIGFAKSDLREPLASHFYSRSAAPFPGGHVIDQNLHLLSAIAVPAPPPLEYPLRVTPPDPLSVVGTALNSLLTSVSKPITLINMGGGWPTKQYDIPFWTTLILNLSTQTTPILIWGSPKEQALAHQLTIDLPIKVAPFLDFCSLIWLISQSQLLVSCDSLALHLADALQVPSVGLFGPTSPQRNGSKLPTSRSIRADVPCDFCYYRECDKMWCRQRLSPADAAKLANEVIAEHG